MKRKLLIVSLILSMLLGTTKVDAASSSLKASASSITKGNSVTITYTVDSSDTIFSIEGSLTCEGTGIEGGIDLNFDDNSNSIYSKTYTYKVTPTFAGTLSCYTKKVRVSDYKSGTWSNISDKSISVTVNTPQVVTPKTYSKNNNLKSLSIDNYELNPTFDKETLEYTVELENKITSIKINAEVEDSTANVNGIGEISVSEGTNKIEIKVTAENGNEKIYVINAIVKELDPINVEINKNKYTIVRKEGIIDPPSSSYEKSTITINDQEILAYINPKTNITLVILKDSKGNTNYYIYDSQKKSYFLYNEYTFNNITLSLIDKSLESSDYKKTSFTYNDSKIPSYILDENKLLNTTYAIGNEANIKKSRFYLFYAMNVETGEENLYSYDTVEKTVQRYNEEELTLYKEKADTYFLYLMILLGVIGATLLTLGIVLIIKSKNSHKRKIR